VIEQMLYEKSSYFNVLNRNKRGITLDLTTADGVRLVKELVRGADAVIENYSNGVLPRLGLDYASLRKINPELVMVSMPAFAADGEWSECRAYGSTLEQASGLPSQSGNSDGPPAMNHIAYGDPIGGLNAAAALLVAIFHKRRANRGQHIDISQVECMLPMVAPWLIEQSANATVAPRLGGRHPSCVPHGCFPCRGDDAWILIAVEDDGQWQALCGAIGRDDLKQDAALATRAGRRLHEGAIERAIAAWTAKMAADDAMATLQHAGVAAGVARPPLELLDDPHLRQRNFWQWIDRAFVGSHPQPSPAYRENDRPLVARHPAPTLGEHNIPVLQEILGLSQTEIDKLAAAGIIGTRAVPPNLRKARAAVG
jgi:crotonobetainyl-CoA:carnitine CoA-transferase CaiB-like acyl-CoA transferase